MGSTTPETIHIPLTPLDHAPPKNYSCSLSYLPLKPTTTPQQAFSILLEGLHRTFIQIPWLSGKVYPQSPSIPTYRPGQLEIRHQPYTSQSPLPYQLKFNELKSERPYEDLKEAGFPTDAFKDEDVAWAPFMPDVPSGAEVLVAQANFIPGACILTAGTFHSASDGVGFVAVFRLWADHCFALQKGGGVEVIPPGLDSSDRGLLERIWGMEAENAGMDVKGIDPGKWTLLGLAPPSGEVEENGHEEQGGGENEKDKEKEEEKGGEKRGSMKSAIFYVPPIKFLKLTRECYGPGVSGTDAIVALIWRCTLRARRAVALRQKKPIGDISDPDALAFLAMTVDGRPYFSQSLPSTYLGNLTYINLCAMPLAHLTSPDTSLATVAQTIRDGANSITTASVLDAYALARSVSDFGQLSLQNASLDGTAMLVSPLLTYPTHSISFGDVLFGNGGYLEALRMPMYSFNRMTRLSFVLPKLAAGGVEFLLNLFAEEMDVLLKDKEFKSFAMFLAN
jgi:hypothetical protein